MPKKQTTAPISTTSVYVYYNSPHAIKFRLTDGRDIVINGSPISELYTPSGAKCVQGKHGITEVLTKDWEEILALYSSMPIFLNKRIFATSSAEYGKDMAKDFAKQANGLEQVDPQSLNTQAE